MTILYHETLNETLADLKNILIDQAEAMPDHIREAIRKQTTELASFGETLKLIYDVPVARGGKETIGPKLAAVAAAGLNVFERSGFLDLGKPDESGSRPAARMRLALLRDAGEPAPTGMKWPPKTEDVERRPLPQPEAEEKALEPAKPAG